MPTYEFFCQECNKSFTLALPVKEYEKKEFQCPECKSTKVKQQITSTQTKTSRKI